MWFFNKFLKDYGVSFLLTYVFNIGMLLGLVFVLQTLSGFFLVLFYSNSSDLAFNSVQYIMNEVNFGWIVRLMHFNGASLIFFFIYIHFLKGLFFFSYRLVEVWMSGILMLILIMAEAFLGYVLVWAQMSFWAGVVISSLLGVIPFFGISIMLWIWGGFLVNNITLKFFFMMHFFLPFIIFFLMAVHLYFLHSYGSTMKLGISSISVNLEQFYPFFWVKDMMNLVVVFFFFIFFLYKPFLLGDPLMFEEVDSLSSPLHIVPEWYFLFAYGILRSIPNKILGVVFMFLSIFIFFIFLLFNNYITLFDLFNKFLVIIFILNCIFLGWLGGCEVLYPFTFLSQMSFFFYFFIIMFIFFNFIVSFFLFM